jgi:DNA polymerase-3 subunit gamma/tau
MPSLSETLRPQKVDEIIGQEHVKKAVKSWIDRDNFPRCQLYTGPVGTGKSSLAEIVARAAQGPGGWDGADIRQINAGAVGKVDDMRALAEQSSSVPFMGRYRVFTLEEAHRATDAAQDALLVPMEVNTSTMWILTSSEPSKLLPGIRSRCSPATFEFKLLTEKEISSLIYRATPSLQSTAHDVAKFLVEHDVRAPREILGVLDQYLAGVPLEEAIHGSEHEPLYPEIAKAALSGNWTKTSDLLRKVPTADYRAMIAVVSAKLSWALLDESVGPRADSIATCLVGLGNSNFADGTAYAATKGLLYKTCKSIGGTK